MFGAHVLLYHALLTTNPPPRAPTPARSAHVHAAPQTTIGRAAL
jgi:hypothetical protein